MVKKNVCVFISGRGTNLKNLIKRSREYNFPIKIKFIICDNKNANGLNYARINSIPYLIVNKKKRDFENLIFLNLKKYKINLICLAGYMKILSSKFLSRFRKKVLNIHPSLLPKFKGLNTFKKVLKYKEKKSGCTVHYVNKKLDSGKIIIKKRFFLDDRENEGSLRNKTQNLEYFAYPEAIISIFRHV